MKYLQNTYNFLVRCGRLESFNLAEVPYLGIEVEQAEARIAELERQVARFRLFRVNRRNNHAIKG